MQPTREVLLAIQPVYDEQGQQIAGLRNWAYVGARWPGISAEEAGKPGNWLVQTDPVPNGRVWWVPYASISCHGPNGEVPPADAEYAIILIGPNGHQACVKKSKGTQGAPLNALDRGILVPAGFTLAARRSVGPSDPYYMTLVFFYLEFVVP